MVFTLLLVGAFMLGGTAGILVMALMIMSGYEPPRRVDPKRRGVLRSRT
jgi:hypothetical protein